jgi:hypothetical protein
MSGKTGDTAQDDAPQPKPNDALNAALQNFAAEAAKNGVSPPVTDAITQALLLILGSGPSIAALDGLIAVQQANGIMYHNAVAHQQKTNLLGMAMTAKCVRYMMDGATSLDEGILDEEHK